MAVLTFKGGTHPPKEKEITKGKSVRVLTPPQSVVIPLSQHIGAPLEPKVKVGDSVKTGQIIGDSASFVSAPIHSSISGKVTKISPAPHPVLGECEAIAIESDGLNEWYEEPEKIDYETLSPEEMKKRIRQAGIVGLGGAAFPTHVKLSPPEEKPIDTVILNGGECEPYLTCDYRIMKELPHLVIIGLKIIMKVLGAQQGYIGIEDDKMDVVKTLQEDLVSERNIEVCALEAKYPQGAEKQLIKAILNREVPSGGLPMDVGVVVHNVGTAAAIAQAVTLGRPLIDRVITVSGQGIAHPQNVRVRIGTLLSDVIDECGGFIGKPGKIIMGGPMMGISQYTLDVPIIKGTSGILIFQAQDLQEAREENCIRCGKCIDVCPMQLVPSLISVYVENRRFDLADSQGVLDCIECGCCAYVCPSKRPIIQLIKFGKSEVLSAKKNQ